MKKNNSKIKKVLNKINIFRFKLIRTLLLIILFSLLLVFSQHLSYRCRSSMPSFLEKIFIKSKSNWIEFDNLENLSFYYPSYLKYEFEDKKSCITDEYPKTFSLHLTSAGKSKNELLFCGKNGAINYFDSERDFINITLTKHNNPDNKTCREFLEEYTKALAVCNPDCFVYKNNHQQDKFLSCQNEFSSNKISYAKDFSISGVSGLKIDLNTFEHPRPTFCYQGKSSIYLFSNHGGTYTGAYQSEKSDLIFNTIISTFKIK